MLPYCSRRPLDRLALYDSVGHSGGFGVMGWFKRKPKTVPVPWDGVHRLKYVLYEEYFGSSPDDYHTGWVWKCNCGNGSPAPYWRTAYTEEAAIKEFTAHRLLYVELEKMI